MTLKADWPAGTLEALKRGTVIPAHLLALTSNRELDVRRQRALSRYYLDAGVGGLAVGVHATQFAIREAGMYEHVLRLAVDTARDWSERPIIMISGVVGRTQQALREADIAAGLGYQAALLCLAAMKDASEDELIEHCQAIAAVIPVIGFYLQPIVGGIKLSYDFWRRLATIDQVVAIKVAPFNRYRTLDVIRGIVAARAEERVTLYTGNDDNIVLDLLTPFVMRRESESIKIRIKGGLLGHWSVWTKAAVDLFERIKQSIHGGAIDADLLGFAAPVTDCNGALFDVANDFRGCIAGCHEVLRRQGLFAGTWCLDPSEVLSRGQKEELDRVTRLYPELTDDGFVTAHRERWLS